MSCREVPNRDNATILESWLASDGSSLDINELAALNDLLEGHERLSAEVSRLRDVAREAGETEQRVAKYHAGDVK